MVQDSSSKGLPSELSLLEGTSKLMFSPQPEMEETSLPDDRKEMDWFMDYFISLMYLMILWNNKWLNLNLIFVLDIGFAKYKLK